MKLILLCIILSVTIPTITMGQNEFKKEIDYRYKQIKDFDWKKKLLSSEYIDGKKCKIKRALQKSDPIIIPNYYFSTDEVTEEDVLEMKNLSFLYYTVHLKKGSKMILGLYVSSFDDKIKCTKNKVNRVEKFVLKNHENNLFNIEGLGGPNCFFWFEMDHLQVQDFSGLGYVGSDENRYNKLYKYKDFIEEVTLKSAIKSIIDSRCQRIYGLGSDECESWYRGLEP